MKPDLVTAKLQNEKAFNYVHLNLQNLCFATYNENAVAYVTASGELTENLLYAAKPEMSVHGNLVLIFNTRDSNDEPLSVSLWGDKAEKLHTYLISQGKYF